MVCTRTPGSSIESSIGPGPTGIGKPLVTSGAGNLLSTGLPVVKERSSTSSQASTGVTSGRLDVEQEVFMVGE